MARFDIGSALSGAASGAALGSSVPGVGTLFGAGAGALAGLFGSKNKKKKRNSTFDPQQQGLYDQQMQGLQGQGQFADLYNFNAETAGQNFDQNVSRPAYRNFQENIIPGITGQFRSGGLQNSSYAAEGLSRAGRDVQEGLNAQRTNYMYQGQEAANQRKAQGAQNLLGMTTFDYQQPGQNGIDQILGSLAQPTADWLSRNFMKGGK